MKKISINEIGSEKNVTQEEMAQLKGGPHWQTWDPPAFVMATPKRGNVTLKRG